MPAPTRIIVHPDPVQALDACLEELADFSQSQAVRRAFLLVPEEAKADTERRYMEQFDRRGLMLGEVVSFRRLAYRLFSEAGGLAYKRIGENGKALLLTRILQAKSNHYPYLGKLAGKASYAAELSQIMGDFSRYGLDPQDLDLALQKGHLTKTSRDKLQDLARLQRDFLELKAQLGLTDGDQDLTRLSQLLRQKDNPRLAFLSEAKVWLAGFGLVRAFTPQELELLAALRDQVSELTLALSPAGLGPQGQLVQADLAAETSFAHQSLKALKASLPGADLVQLAPAVQVCLPPRSGPGLRPDQASVREVQFAPSVQVFLPPRSGPGLRPDQAFVREVQLWQSTNVREELAAAAGEIKLLLSQKNYRRRDIAVALCRSEDLDRASAIFADFGLDSFIAEARPLEESPLYRYLDLFCQLASGQAKPQDLIALAQTGLVGLAQDPAPFRLDLDHYENFLLASPARFLHDLSRDWLYSRREGGPEAQAFYQTYLAPQVQAAADLRQASSGRAKAAYLLRWLDQDSGIRDQVQTWAQDLHLAGESERALVLANSWEAVLSSLEEIADLLGEEGLSQADFADLLLSALRGKKPQGIPLGLDRIRLGSPQQILLYPAKVLFILGATAGTFPGPAPAEGLLHNAEREEIEAATARVLPNYRRDAARSGRALTHYLTLRGSDALYLSCPSLDQEDLSDLQIELASRTDLKLVKRVFAETSYPDQRWLSPSLASRYLAGSQDKPAAWQASWRQLLAPYQAEWAPDPLDAARPHIYLAPDLTADLMAQVQALSVSRLQTFNNCPYQYFAQYTLGLRERELYQPKPHKLGSFLHALMEKSLADLIDRLGPHRQDPERVRQVLAAWQADLNPDYIQDLYQALSQTPDFQTYQDPVIREVQGLRLRRKALSALSYEAQNLQESPFLPLALEWQFPRDPASPLPAPEWQFSQKTASPPLALYLGGRPILLRGTIDRIDLDQTGGARLIDYKSGKTTLDQEALLCGQQLQLPLYARAWEASQDQSQVTELALETLLMEKREVLTAAPDRPAGRTDRLSRLNSEKVSGLSLGLLSDYALAYSQALLDKMSTGDLSPQPLVKGKEDPTCQPYCPYKAICRFEEQTREARTRRIQLDYEGNNLTKQGLVKYLEGFQKTGLLASQQAAQDQDQGASQQASQDQTQGPGQQASQQADQDQRE